MKKILLVLLLLFLMPISISAEEKYEFKGGILYNDGKKVTGTFELISRKNKAKGSFVNGLPDGIFERYYPDGSIFIKDEFKDGTLIKEEIFYKSGETLATATDGKYLKLFDKDGRLVESYDADKDKNIIYHENGKPLIITIGRDSTIYNENSEILSKEENGKIVDLDMIIKNVGNGLSEIIMDDKVIAKMNNNTGVLTYFYSTGEPMITTNSSTAETQFFFKNGNIFFKSNGKEFILYHKDGKPIHELNEGITKYYNEDGDEILMNSYKVEDIKKID